MATLQELHELFRNREMLDRTEAALIITAHGRLQGTPDEPTQRYAAAIFGNPASEAEKALKSVLAANAGACCRNTNRRFTHHSGHLGITCSRTLNGRDPP